MLRFRWFFINHPETSLRAEIKTQRHKRNKNFALKGFRGKSDAFMKHGKTKIPREHTGLGAQGERRLREFRGEWLGKGVREAEGRAQKFPVRGSDIYWILMGRIWLCRDGQTGKREFQTERARVRVSCPYEIYDQVVNATSSNKESKSADAIWKTVKLVKEAISSL